MNSEILEKKEELPSETILKEKTIILKDPTTKNDFTCFLSDCNNENLLEKQTQIYEYLNSLPQKLKLIPKFYEKKLVGLMFQPLRKTLRTYLTESPINECKNLIIHYKTLINGLSYLQTLGINAVELNLDSIYISDACDFKILLFEKTEENNYYIHPNLVDFAKLIISLAIGKDFILQKNEFSRKREYNEVLERGLSEIISKIHTNTFEEKDYLWEIVETLRKILSYDGKEKIDFVKLFLKSLQFKSYENIKKMIFIEETHGLEIAYDILIKKDSMKFELNSLDQNFKVFGFSSVPMEKDFDKIEEIKSLLEEIKPIRSLNVHISCDIDPQIQLVLDNIINKKLFRLDDFKTLTIQTTPHKQLVGCSEWYKFIWHTFYKKGLNPIDNSGLSIIKQHTSYWGNGICKDNVQKLFELIDRNWIKERKIEQLRIVLSSYYLLPQENLKLNVFPQILSLKFKKLKSLEIGFEICNLKDEYMFTSFLKTLGLKLRQENKDGLGTLSILLYTYYNQGLCFDEIAEILSFQNQMHSLSLFFREITNKMAWEQFLAALTPQKLAYLSSLTIGFGSWVYPPFLSDQPLTLFFSKILKNLSQKLQNLSLLIYTQGIVEESFRILSDILYLKSADLLSCNFYFEGYVENENQKRKSDILKEEIQKNLSINKVEVNSMRIDLYKKK